MFIASHGPLVLYPDIVAPEIVPPSHGSSAKPWLSPLAGPSSPQQRCPKVFASSPASLLPLRCPSVHDLSLAVTNLLCHVPTSPDFVLRGNVRSPIPHISCSFADPSDVSNCTKALSRAIDPQVSGAPSVSARIPTEAVLSRLQHQQRLTVSCQSAIGASPVFRFLQLPCLSVRQLHASVPQSQAVQSHRIVVWPPTPLFFVSPEQEGCASHDVDPSE
mmetsp:Transcript_44741/g.118688  ORF Transcript_44741/g.118688 Transcript_44741/m.118688 type:complete len:218 (-) Transcript_44741:761-1414(-)